MLPLDVDAYHSAIFCDTAHFRCKVRKTSLRPYTPCDSVASKRYCPKCLETYGLDSYRIRTLSNPVENLLSKLTGNQDIVVNVCDVADALQPMVMYGPQSPDGKVLLLHVSMLDFGDPFGRHEMRCRLIASIFGTNFVGCFAPPLMLVACAVSEDCRKMEELKTQAEAVDVAKSQFQHTFV